MRFLGTMCKKAYLLGSRARGDHSPESDVDIRLLCGHQIRIGDLVEIHDVLVKRLGCDVDVVSAAPERLRPHFYQSIQKDEVKLYAA